MATPYTAYGTKLQLSLSSVFTDVAAVVRINPPGLTRETIDVTHLQSPNNWREHIGSLKDGGEVSMMIVFDPGDTSHKALHNALNATAVDAWKVVWPDASTSTDWTFSAWLTGFNVTADLGNRIEAEITLKVTGAVTLPS